MKILVYGYGNPGRQDDCLGVLFSEKIAAWAEKNGIKGISCDSNYQLNAEDALTVSENDLVLFADASKEEIESFNIRRIYPSDTISFSTHSMSPTAVLGLCRELYKKEPEAHLLTIRGYEWEVNEPPSAKALKNLESAFEKTVFFIQSRFL